MSGRRGDDETDGPGRAGERRPSRASGGAAPDAPFRPVRGRRMPLVVAVLAIVIFVGVALLLPAWSPGDRALMAGLGLALAGFMWRYASIRAVPGEHGLRVRNLLLSREVPWDEVEGVRFAEGDPWVTLHLLDGDDLAVMAVQRADGERGRQEARRLADLIESRRAAPPRP